MTGALPYDPNEGFTASERVQLREMRLTAADALRDGIGTAERVLLSEMSLLRDLAAARGLHLAPPMLAPVQGGWQIIDLLAIGAQGDSISGAIDDWCARVDRLYGEAQAGAA
ncbi:hypothetical protein ACXN5S_17790 [Pseudoroseicyclus sp. H15]